MWVDLVSIHEYSGHLGSQDYANQIDVKEIEKIIVPKGKAYKYEMSL